MVRIVSVLIAFTATAPLVQARESGILAGDLASPDPGRAEVADLQTQIDVLRQSLREKVDKPNPEEEFTCNLFGRLYSDYNLFADQSPANRAYYGDQENYFEIRQMRLGAKGKGFEIFDYKLQITFEPEGSTDGAGTRHPLTQPKDAFVGVKNVPYLGRMKFGHQKVETGITYMNSSRFFVLMERPLAVAMFKLDRRWGITSANLFADDRVRFFWGLYAEQDGDFAVEKEYRGDRQGAIFNLRATAAPIYSCDGYYLLHLGGHFSHVYDADEHARFRGKPLNLHEGDYFIDTGTFWNASYNTGGLEAAASAGPWNLVSEMFMTSYDSYGAQPHRNVYGASVEGTYFLTGEFRTYQLSTGQFRNISVRRPVLFSGARHGHRVRGWGAWQVAARWSYVDGSQFTPQSADAGTMHDFTLGLNWYWNDNMRMMLQWGHVFPDVRDAGATEADIVSMAVRCFF